MPSPPKRKSAVANRQPPSGTISLADAKAHLSSVISGVQRSRTRITILKRGIPVARVIHIDVTSATLFGSMRGAEEILGDIIGPAGVVWNLKDA